MVNLILKSDQQIRHQQNVPNKIIYDNLENEGNSGI